MRTVFITIFQGVEAKNILRTDIYKKLIARDDVRIIFFARSPERADYYQKEFSHSRVVYESVEKEPQNFWDKIFGYLKTLLLRTETNDLRRRMTLEESGNYFRYIIGLLLNRIFARPLIRQIVRRLDYLLVRDHTFTDYFEKYHPDAVFLAHLFDDLEVNLLREAKRRGIETIGFINSWDKLTARATMRLLPDRLVVFNDLVKQEAIDYAEMSEDRIFVAGVPHYDWHINYQPLSHEEFFRKKGLNPAKKLIVYAPMGKTYSNSDWDIIDLLRDATTRGFVKNAQLLVRFQPNDFTDEAELKKRPDLIYDLPGVRFSSKRGVDWDMSFDDIHGLTDTLANADLFVCYASSMSIDAAVFDKPVINIDFEVRDRELMSKSPTHFYKMTHYQKAVRTGGIRYPKSKEEFFRDIDAYLEDSKLDAAGRKRLVEEQCYKLDGKAGERIADFILTTNACPARD